MATLALSGLMESLSGEAAIAHRQLYEVSENPDLPKIVASTKAFLVGTVRPPVGYGAYIINRPGAPDLTATCLPVIRLPETTSFLGEGDIIRISKANRRYRIIFRKKSHSNSFLLTERCNHLCLMCSQPPKEADDSYLLEEAAEAIRLLPVTTSQIGFTGGEPTLYGEQLIDLLRLAKARLPNTSLHILSNGRRFSDLKYAESYASVQHPDIMLGIPVYSDDATRHDYVVQSEGAFDETIKGILNLKRLGQKVEIRVVLSKQTIPTLVSLSRYIARNLLFVDQVALMGLEITGFTKGNLNKLWIDPYEYKSILAEAALTLDAYRIPVRIYNHQLCVINPTIHRLSVNSISDWKNEYVEECAACALKSKCGGFFGSGNTSIRSKSIKPF